MSYFPRESFLVVKAEDYFAKPRQTLQRIFRHLSFKRELSSSEWAHILAAAEIRTAASGKRILPEVRAQLEQFYKPYNEDLASMLGDSKWTWASEHPQ